jgi:hypothetical protein
MTQRNNILQELSELKSSLSGHVVENVFEVPPGYFEDLPQILLNRIKALETKNSIDSALLNTVSRQMPYSVPQDYFEELPYIVLNRIQNENKSAVEELEAISPLLSGIDKKMPYSVPPGYFENLGNERKSNPAKVISITHKRKWIRYAAAAVITGIIALGGFFIFNKQNNNEGKSLARFEKTLNKEIQKMSDKELSDFIQYTAIANTDEKLLNETKPESQDLLKDVPDTELKQFLNETADPEVAEDVKPLMN